MIAATLVVLLFGGCGGIAIDSVSVSEKNTSEFSSVDVTTSCSRIEFVSSDRYGFDIFVPGSFTPEWDITDGRLTILENTGISIFRLGIFSPSYYVKVYCPSGSVFDEISLTSASGRINLPKTDVAKLDIRSASGRVDAYAENFTNASIVTASGSITFSGSGGNASLDSSSGTVRSMINDCESMKITTNSGSVNLTGKGESDTALTVNTASGRIQIDGTAWRDATTSTSSGKTEISGELLGNTSVETASGSVNISVHGSPSQYGYSLTPVSGSVHWDGNKMAKPAFSSGSFDNHITVNTASGGIRVSFTKR